MSDNRPNKFPVRLQIEEVCSAFEENWTVDSISLIADTALQFDIAVRAEVVIELVAIDYELRQSTSHAHSKEDYGSLVPFLSDGVSNALRRWMAELEASEMQLDKERPELQSQQIGDYRIVGLVGRGGAGVVYEAVQESLERPVAIKMLTNAHVTSQLSRFRQEAKAIALLHHTNIVEVYGSGVHNGQPYFAMQLIEGKSLSEILVDAQLGNESKRRLSSSEPEIVGPRAQRSVANIGLQVARALQHAHEQGVLHRDIKPSNLLVDQNGITWVGDFGLAKLSNQESDNTLDGNVVGTLRYLPPEAFSGTWSERSDIYSLGVTLFELLTLNRVYSESDNAKLIKQVTQGDSQLIRVRQIDDSISQDLETIVAKAMSFDADRRFSTVGELGDELERYLDGIPIKSRPIGLLERVWRWSKRKPTAAALAALICAVAFIGLPIAMWLWLSASSALKVAEASKATAISAKLDAENSRARAEADRYSNGVLLAQNYIDDGQALDARRLIGELTNSEFTVGSLEASRDSDSLPWELAYLDQQLDSSVMTLRGDEKYEVWHVAMRPDDCQVATVHGCPPLDSNLEGEVILWDFATGKKEKVLRGHGSRVFGCAYSSDGKQLATIGLNLDSPESRGTLCLWDVATGKRTKMVNLSGEFPKLVLAGYGTPVLPGVMFGANDEQVITWPTPIEVRDAKTLEVIWATEDRSATFLPDGRALTYSGTQLDIRNVETGEVEKMAGGQWHNFAYFAFNSNEKRMSCKAMDSMRLWESAEKIDEYVDISIPGICWGAVCPDGSQFVYGARKGELKIEAYDRSNADYSRSLLGHQVEVTSGVFNGDGSQLVTASRDGTAKIWQIASVPKFAETNLTHARLSTIGFSANGTQIHFASRRTTESQNQHCAGTITCGESEVSKTEIETTYFADWPRGDFEFSHDGQFLAAPISEPVAPKKILGPAQGGKLGIWKCDSWSLGRCLETGFSSIMSTSWSSSGRLLAVAGQTTDQSGSQVCLKVYQFKHNSQTLIRELKFETGILALCLEDNDLAVATKGHLTTWSISETQSSQTQTSFQFDKKHKLEIEAQVVCLDFSPDGSKLAVADHDASEMIVLEAGTGELLYRQPGPRKLCCVQFSPNGNRLALSGFDGIVHLCDANYGNRLLTLTRDSPSPGTKAINSRVVFSPDGRRIATNNWLGRIDYWEIHN